VLGSLDHPGLPGCWAHSTHPGLPGVLGSFDSSKPTRGAGLIRLIQAYLGALDFTPGYIAERLCREEMLDLAGMMMSPRQ
jgi:hypothetical protein